MERTADFRDHITYFFPKHTDRVLHYPTALYTAIDMFDPDTSSGQLLIECLFFVRKDASAWFLERCDATYAVECKCEEAKILQEMTS
jgi:hypothetical protein